MSVEIVKGEDKTFSVDITDKDGNAFDLTGFTEITARFLQSAGTPLDVITTPDANGGVASTANQQLCGRIEVTLTDVGSALLESGDSQDLEIIVEDSLNELTILQLAGQLKVKERLIS